MDRLDVVIDNNANVQFLMKRIALWNYSEIKGIFLSKVYHQKFDFFLNNLDFISCDWRLIFKASSGDKYLLEKSDHVNILMTKVKANVVIVCSRNIFLKTLYNYINSGYCHCCYIVIIKIYYLNLNKFTCNSIIDNIERI